MESTEVVLMIPARRSQRVTVADYLRFEAEAKERHEYLDGKIFAMAGESGHHADITFNLVGIIAPQLKGTPCRGRTKDTKVRSGPPGPRPLHDTAGLYSYPDLVVICGEPEYFDDRQTVITNPKIIIEVLSPSTEGFDRGEKFERYERWNPTLTDYVLVRQERPVIEHFERQTNGKWLMSRLTGLESIVNLSSLGVTIRLADVYDRIAFPEPEPEDG